MKSRAYEWDPRPPTIRERIICGIWLAAFVPVLANQYAGWKLFRGYDTWIFGGVLLAGLFLITRLAGTKRVEGVPRPLGYWLVVGLGLIAAAVLYALGSRS
jgi:hypothetical protein